MIAPARTLFHAFAQSADGYQRDDVVVAAANLLLNAMRQSHKTRGAAFEELDAVLANIKRELGQHYDDAGNRKVQNVILPKPLMEMVRDLTTN